MTWADFYLICFAAGFAFSFFSFLTGGMRWHLHLPHSTHGLGHGMGAGHGAAGHGASTGHAPAGGAAQIGGGRLTTSTYTSPFNFITFAAFLAWFGGTGYLLTRYSTLWFVMGIGVAAVSGIGGASLVYLFISKVLTSKEENMDPADYDMVGVLGRITSPVRVGGTGELIYSQAGTRRVCGCRSEGSEPLEKGSEVVVTRYEKGIAYVRRWQDMAGDDLLEEPGPNSTN
jgi:membrane protein implicated in regulation of membrane protease activity